jgi:transposase
MLPIGSKRVWLVAELPRVECSRCWAVRQIPIAFARPRRTYTRNFERYVLELCRLMTMQDVACHLGVGWDVVKEIQASYLQKHYARPKLKHLRQIAIDEISIGRGHRYLTVVLDLQTGQVVFVGQGKGGSSGSCVPSFTGPPPARRSGPLSAPEGSPREKELRAKRRCFSF